MDTETRADRVWMVKHIMKSSYEPESPYPPVFALWMAAPVAYLSDGAAESARQDLLSAAADRKGSAVARLAAANAALWPAAVRWLGLNEESIPEMFMPELLHADWRAAAGTPGYITRYAVDNMLDHYAAAGSVVWPAPGPEINHALQRLCETSGIIWAAWQPQTGEGWHPPGTEKTAIVRFAPDAPAVAERHPLERQFSDIVGCNVSLITPDQILEPHRTCMLAQAEVVYAQAH